jgi:hypothetical protein
VGVHVGVVAPEDLLQHESSFPGQPWWRVQKRPEARRGLWACPASRRINFLVVTGPCIDTTCRSLSCPAAFERMQRSDEPLRSDADRRLLRDARF